MIRVRILADTIAPTAPRLTTFELVYPRIIHSEVMTYRTKSRNASSSRAVPVERMIAAIEEEPFIPTAFSGAQKGMAGGPPLEGEADRVARAIWARAAGQMVVNARELAQVGVHKQHANRLLEPFAHITTILSSVNWTRWDRERISDDAQPEIRELAETMRAARFASVPRMLQVNEYGSYIGSPWHVPGMSPEEYHIHKLKTYEPNHRPFQPHLIAAGRLARTSYLRREETRDPTEEVVFALDLERRGHWSPFEHVARPMMDGEIQLGPLTGWRTFRHSEEERLTKEAIADRYERAKAENQQS